MRLFNLSFNQFKIKLFLIILMLFTGFLIYTPSIYAENNQAEEGTLNTASGSNSSDNSNTSSGGGSGDVNVINGNSNFNSNTNAVIGMLEDASNKMSSMQASADVSKTDGLARMLAWCGRFVFSILPGWLLFQSSLEFFCLVVTPVGGLIESVSAGENSSGGDAMGGSGSKKKYALLSADYFAAKSGNSGGDAMGGGGSGGKGLAIRLKAFFSLKIKTIFICIIIMIFLISPLGFNLMLWIVNKGLAMFSKFTGSLF